MLVEYMRLEFRGFRVRGIYVGVIDIRIVLNFRKIEEVI